MDTPPDDLNDLERRLTALSPAGDGLDADSMLFAAGRSSVQSEGHGLRWPAVAGLLALLACGLGAWGINERGDRLHLARQWDQAMRQPLNGALAPQRDPVPESASADWPAADSMLASHRILEHGLDGLIVPRTGPSPQVPPPSDPPVLRARPTDGWPEL
jgi:hypothetical protein